MLGTVVAMDPFAFVVGCLVAVAAPCSSQIFPRLPRALERSAQLRDQ